MCDCKKSNTNCNCQCPPSEKGDPGLNWVYASTVEAPGSNCVYGGFLVQGGPDNNNDGLPDQVLNQFYVCNGAPSQQYVVKVTAESAGANCTYGGVKIETGLDADNDGVPDSSIQTSYICTPAPGAAGITPVFTAGTVTAVPNGDPLTITVDEVSPNVYTISLEVPEGPAGANDSASITVSAVTAACMATELASATTVTDYLNEIIAKICSMSAGIASKTYAFLGLLNRQITTSEIATNAILDPDPGGGQYFYIPFPDDTVGGYDNGNNFHSDIFVATAGMPAMTFATENLIFQGTDPAPAVPKLGIIQIAIVEKGATPTVDVVHASTNLNVSNDQDTITVLNSLLTGSVTPVATKKYAVRLRGGDAAGYLIIANGEFVINEGGKFSNNY